MSDIRCMFGLHDWLLGSVTISVWPVECGEFFGKCRHCGKCRR